MIEYYPTLVEAVIEFKKESRQMIATYNKQDYVVLPEHERVEPLQKDYELKKE